MTRAGVMEIFRELKREKAVILITHDPEEAKLLADQTIYIQSI